MEWSVIHGDCLDIMPTLGVTFDACITDPPYGVNLGVDKDMRGGSHGLAKKAYANYEDTYENYCRIIVPAIERALLISKRGAVFVGPHFQELPKAAALGGVYCSAATGRHRWGFNTLLPVLFYGTDPALQFGARPTILQSNARAEESSHPCPKPLEWMVWLVERVTLPGETVIDPLCGSGTTGVACVLTGRNFVGIEIDPHYCAIAEARIKRACGIPCDIPRPTRALKELPLFATA